MQDEEKKEQRITPGFVPVRDLINQSAVYGMSASAILELIQIGSMKAHTLSRTGMHWLPVVDLIDYRDCYIKESDANQCFCALQKMVLYKQKYCVWKRMSGPFDTDTELCSIYLPYLVEHNPYIPRNVINGCMDLCECDLNNSGVVEVAYHTEEEREQAVLCNDHGASLSPDHVDVVIGAYAAFSMAIRPRNTGIAKSNQYYPVRYVKMDLPE